MEQNALQGFKYANWEKGFGDFHCVPDLSTLRHCSWLDRTAMVICDIEDDTTHQAVDVAPRNMLRRQLGRLQEFGYKAVAASELEFYTYTGSYNNVAHNGFDRRLNPPVSQYNEDYHLLQTMKEEPLIADIRRHLKASGIPVETSKGEAGFGQHEVNVKYAECLEMADRHSVYKQLCKEVAINHNQSLTFMAKPFTDCTGSGCHLHVSLHDATTGTNVFQGNEDIEGIQCSPVFQHFLAGWLAFSAEMMPFYAPTINSYKRFVSSSWAPTRIAWSKDNRTAGFRIVGSGKSLRIECRFPGADANVRSLFAFFVYSVLHPFFPYVNTDLLGIRCLNRLRPRGHQAEAATASVIQWQHL